MPTLKTEAANLSVVVPCYNSARDLTSCLSALTSSTYENFDVLVVDDGSTEPIKHLVDAAGFKYVRIDGPSGPARARNFGVCQVASPYVVFIDADVCVHPDTLSRIAETFAADDQIDAVIGLYDEAPAKPNFLSQYKNLFHHYVHQESHGIIGTFWSGCGAIKRELFLTFGGFDEDRYRRPAIEDIELGTWLAAAGKRIVLDRQIKVKHLKKWTLLNLLKTDVFDRGIPWTRLMLRAGALANTLNVTPVQRFSVVLSYLAPLLLIAAVLWPVLWYVVWIPPVLLTFLNLNFYRFFLNRSGLWFTLRVVPLHWLYFWYCGFSFACGILGHYLAGESGGKRPVQRDYTFTSDQVTGGRKWERN